jgi:hypothetical protein
LACLAVLGGSDFALVVRRWDELAIARRVDELARLLGVRHLLERRPPDVARRSHSLTVAPLIGQHQWAQESGRVVG